MIRKTLPQRLDDSVRWTGIPALAQGHPRRRHLRVAPAIALLMAFGAIALSIATADLRWPGYILSALAFAVSVWVPLFGPIKPWGSFERTDERERAIRAEAYLVTFPVVLLVAVVGLMVAPALTVLASWPAPRLELLLFGFGFTVLTLYNALPSLYASLTTRRPATDEED